MNTIAGLRSSGQESPALGSLGYNQSDYARHNLAFMFSFTLVADECGHPAGSLWGEGHKREQNRDHVSNLFASQHYQSGSYLRYSFPELVVR